MSLSPALTSAQSIQIIHFSDLHLWRFGLAADPWPKRLLGLVNLALKRRKRFPHRVAELMGPHLLGEDADFALFSGDLSTTSLPQEFAAGERFLAPLGAKWGKRLVVIPGNHDRYTPKAMRQNWFEQHVAAAVREYPFALPLNDDWALVAFDCSVPRIITSRGKLDDAQFEALRDVLKREGAGRKLIVVGHYPIVYPPGRKASPEHELENPQRVGELLNEMGVKAYLHGHKHERWAVQAGGCLHLNAGSCGMIGGKQGGPGYLKFTLAPGGVENVTAKWVEIKDGAEPMWREAPLEIQE